MGAERRGSFWLLANSSVGCMRSRPIHLQAKISSFPCEVMTTVRDRPLHRNVRCCLLVPDARLIHIAKSQKAISHSSCSIQLVLYVLSPDFFSAFECGDRERCEVVSLEEDRFICTLPLSVPTIGLDCFVSNSASTGYGCIALAIQHTRRFVEDFDTCTLSCYFFLFKKICRKERECHWILA